MSDKSAIEWTDATWTPIRARNIKTGKVGWHCEHATTGCEFCYAEGLNNRLGTGLPFKPGHRRDIEIFLDDKMLLAPLKWKRPRMIFVCSMTDLFADFVSDEWIDKVFAVMALSPQHTFQVLTKRAARMRAYMTDPLQQNRMEVAAERIKPSDGKPWSPRHVLPRILSNVWLGVSTERQQEADERIPLLLQTPAAVRFISAEPLLAPIDLTQSCAIWWGKPGPGAGPFDMKRRPLLDWVIVGGESGPNARPMHPDWARGLRDQCEAAGVAFFFKQWGAFKPVGWVHADSCSAMVRKDGHICRTRAELAPADNFEMALVGKAKAGRLLDGIEHNGMPGRSA